MRRIEEQRKKRRKKNTMRTTIMKIAKPMKTKITAETSTQKKEEILRI